jgi:hypothetical protein
MPSNNERFDGANQTAHKVAATQKIASNAV